MGNETSIDVNKGRRDDNDNDGLRNGIGGHHRQQQQQLRRRRRLRDGDGLRRRGRNIFPDGDGDGDNRHDRTKGRHKDDGANIHSSLSFPGGLTQTGTGLGAVAAAAAQPTTRKRVGSRTRRKSIVANDTIYDSSASVLGNIGKQQQQQQRSRRSRKIASVTNKAINVTRRGTRKQTTTTAKSPMAMTNVETTVIHNSITPSPSSKSNNVARAAARRRTNRRKSYDDRTESRSLSSVLLTGTNGDIDSDDDDDDELEEEQDHYNNDQSEEDAIVYQSDSNDEDYVYEEASDDEDEEEDDDDDVELEVIVQNIKTTKKKTCPMPTLKRKGSTKSIPAPKGGKKLFAASSSGSNKGKFKGNPRSATSRTATAGVGATAKTPSDGVSLATNDELSLRRARSLSPQKDGKNKATPPKKQSFRRSLSLSSTRSRDLSTKSNIGKSRTGVHPAIVLMDSLGSLPPPESSSQRPYHSTSPIKSPRKLGSVGLGRGLDSGASRHNVSQNKEQQDDSDSLSFKSTQLTVATTESSKIRSRKSTLRSKSSLRAHNPDAVDDNTKTNRDKNVTSTQQRKKAIASSKTNMNELEGEDEIDGKESNVTSSSSSPRKRNHRSIGSRPDGTSPAQRKSQSNAKLSTSSSTNRTGSRKRNVYSSPSGLMDLFMSPSMPSQNQQSRPVKQISKRSRGRGPTDEYSDDDGDNYYYGSHYHDHHPKGKPSVSVQDSNERRSQPTPRKKSREARRYAIDRSRRTNEESNVPSEESDMANSSQTESKSSVNEVGATATSEKEMSVMNHDDRDEFSEKDSEPSSNDDDDQTSSTRESDTKSDTKTRGRPNRIRKPLATEDLRTKDGGHSSKRRKLENPKQTKNTQTSDSQSESSRTSSTSRTSSASRRASDDKSTARAKLARAKSSRSQSGDGHTVSSRRSKSSANRESLRCEMTETNPDGSSFRVRFNMNGCDTSYNREKVVQAAASAFKELKKTNAEQESNRMSSSNGHSQHDNTSVPRMANFESTGHGNLRNSDARSEVSELTHNWDAEHVDPNEDEEDDNDDFRNIPHDDNDYDLSSRDSDEAEEADKLTSKTTGSEDKMQHGETIQTQLSRTSAQNTPKARKRHTPQSESASPRQQGVPLSFGGIQLSQNIHGSDSLSLSRPTTRRRKKRKKQTSLDDDEDNDDGKSSDERQSKTQSSKDRSSEDVQQGREDISEGSESDNDDDAVGKQRSKRSKQQGSSFDIDNWTIDYSYLSNPEYIQEWDRQQQSFGVPRYLRTVSRPSSSSNSNRYQSSSTRYRDVQRKKEQPPKRGPGRPKKNNSSKKKRNNNALDNLPFTSTLVSPPTTTTEGSGGRPAALASWRESRAYLRALMEDDETDQDWV